MFLAWLRPAPSYADQQEARPGRSLGRTSSLTARGDDRQQLTSQGGAGEHPLLPAPDSTRDRIGCSWCQVWKGSRFSPMFVADRGVEPFVRGPLRMPTTEHCYYRGYEISASVVELVRGYLPHPLRLAAIATINSAYLDVAKAGRAGRGQASYRPRSLAPR